MDLRLCLLDLQPDRTLGRATAVFNALEESAGNSKRWPSVLIVADVDGAVVLQGEDEALMQATIRTLTLAADLGLTVSVTNSYSTADPRHDEICRVLSEYHGKRTAAAVDYIQAVCAEQTQEFGAN